MSTDSYVPAEGPEDAQIMLVGEAPGQQEARDKRPFVGHSGNLLRRTLLQNGVEPRSVYLTNVCHHRPPNNSIARWIKLTSRKGVNEHTKAQIKDKRVAEGIKELYADMARIKPNVVIPTGNVALWALTGLTRVNKRRGSMYAVSWDDERTAAMAEWIDDEFLANVEAVKGTKIYATLHPAYILRQMHLLAVFDYDIQEAIRESATPALDLPTPRIIIDPGPSELEQLVAQLRNSSLISFDIEVVGGDTLFCCGFACTTEWALTLTPTSPERLSVIKSLLESDVPKLAQNGIFDITWLRRFAGISVGGEQHDTLVAHAIAYPDLPKGLDFIGSFYTRFPYHKDEGKNWNPRDAADVQRFLEYNAKDVLVTLAAYESMRATELAEGHEPTYRRIMSQQPVYEDMMTKGIQVDVPEMTMLRRKYESSARAVQSRLDRHVSDTLTSLILKTTDEKRRAKLTEFKEAVEKGRGTPRGGLNVNSTKQLRVWLYDILRLPVKTNRGSSTPTTNETALKELYAATKDESLLWIWQIREKRKRVSSFLKIQTRGDGRTFFSVMPVKTKTGRSACGKTILGEGINMQTQPHELRSIFVPDDPAFEFGYVDLSQAEARIVAYKAGIERMIQAFESGEDLHKLTASLIFGIPYDEVEEYPHRYLGKRCNHAFNYEMGPYKFFSVVNNDTPKTGVAISRAEAKKMRNAHLQAYPELNFYWDEIRAQLRKDRTLVNPFGRRRVFLGRLDDSTYREAFSHYAQSTVADVLRTGMLRVHQYLPTIDPRARVVLEVHDAILIQYPKEARDVVIPEVISLMREPILVGNTEITIPPGAEVGPNWQEMSKYVSRTLS